MVFGIDDALMIAGAASAGGGLLGGIFGKKKKTTVPMPYGNNFHSATFSSDFGRGAANFDPATGQIKTNSRLTDTLRGAGLEAQRGLKGSLGYLEQTPTQHYANIGADPYYQILDEQTKRSLDDLTARGKVDAYSTGNTNSTAYGGLLGSIYNDNALRRNQNVLSAIDFGNNTARTNAATQLGSIQGLAGLVNPLASQANAQLNQGILGNQSASQFNAGQNAQANQQSAGMWGNLTNAGLTMMGLPFLSRGGTAAGGAASLGGGASLGGYLSGPSAGGYTNWLNTV